MKLLCIVGPTGVGKNEVAIKIARECNGEIINFDSRQVFKYFPIVTAQPTEEEKKVCSHHLYGFLEPSESINAGKFSELVHNTVKMVWERKRLPILVGGTGLYLKAILEGLAPIPDVPEKTRKKVLKELEVSGSEAMHKKLKKIDPETAARLHPKDWQRITRALEVYEATGKPISWWQKTYPPRKRYDYFKIGIKIDMDTLKKKLWNRIEKMLIQGAIDEIKSALKNTIPLNSPVWSSIGCVELLRFIKGKLSLEEAKKKWFKETKDYARRQIIWFKREKDIIWFGPKETKKILEVVKRWLNQ